MKRIVPGILMALGSLGILFWGSVEIIRTVIACIAALGLVEYFRMSLPALRGGILSATILCALLPVIFVFAGTLEMVMAAMVAVLLCTALMSLKAVSEVGNGFTYLSFSCFGSLYISTSLAHLGLVAGLGGGTYWLVVLLALISGSDTGAYYFGKKFGKKKLCPSISPKKTVAGAVGGIAVGTLFALIVLFLLPLDVDFTRFVPLAILLIIIGIAGDLVESTIKRSFNIKDSGTILGGHGGLLDRIDSLLLSGPLLYYLLIWGVL